MPRDPSAPLFLQSAQNDTPPLAVLGPTVSPLSNAYFKIDTGCPQALNGECWSKTWQSRPKLNFIFTEDELSIGDAAEADWNEVQVIGRSEAYKVYSGTGNRVIGLQLLFQAQGDGGNLKESLKSEVQDKVNWLRALAYPFYTANGRMLPPPVVRLYFGELFKELRGIVPAPSVTWGAPWDPESRLPYRASVQCDFVVTNESPMGSDSILGGSF